jgi:hypothetical protein
MFKYILYAVLVLKIQESGLNITKFYVPPTVCLCILCGSLNKQRCFLYTALTDWCFITETESVYCAVRAETLNIIKIILSL